MQRAEQPLGRPPTDPSTPKMTVLTTVTKRSEFGTTLMTKDSKSGNMNSKSTAKLPAAS